MFYVVVLHPHIPGISGEVGEEFDPQAVESYLNSHPDEQIEVTSERILTSDLADRPEAEFVGQMLANETRHPVAVYDDSDVPAEIRESVAKNNSQPVADDLNRMALGQFFGQNRSLLN